MVSWIDRKAEVRLPGALQRFRGDEIFDQAFTADFFPSLSVRAVGDSTAGSITDLLPQHHDVIRGALAARSFSAKLHPLDLSTHVLRAFCGG
jgi:hypothetical protein